MRKVELCRVYKLGYKMIKLSLIDIAQKKTKSQNKVLGKGTTVKQASKVKRSKVKKLTA